MNENVQNWITSLENAWAENGFLWKVRQGDFNDHEGEVFIKLLLSIKLNPDEPLNRRFVSLIWYLPLFLSWQTERVIENGGNRLLYETFTNKVSGIIEDILGVP